MDRQVATAGVRDAGTARIEYFPELRVDRFLNRAPFEIWSFGVGLVSLSEVDNLRVREERLRVD
jgi:hypothetical protein